MRKKLRPCWTCSDFVHHEHATRIGAWLCGRWQYWRARLSGGFWSFLPTEIILDSGQFMDFVDDLQKALGEAGVRVYAVEDNRDIPLRAVAEIPVPSDADAGATVDEFAETMMLPMVQYTVAWPTWDRLVSSAEQPDLSPLPAQRAAQALVAGWRRNLSARSVWFRPKSVTLTWEYRVTPCQTLHNWLKWLLTRNPWKLGGQRITWYRARAQVAAWDQVPWG